MTSIGYFLCVFCELPLKGGAEKKRGGKGRRGGGVGETRRRGDGGRQEETRWGRDQEERRE